MTLTHVETSDWTRLKRRLYAIAIWGTVLMVSTFLMNWDPQVGIAVLFYPLFVMVPASLALLIWNLVAIVTLWHAFRLWSLCPLFLFGLTLWCGGTAGSMVGFHLRLERFERHLPEYQEIVDLLKKGDINELRRRDMKIATNEPDYMSIDLPDNLHHLGWGIRVLRGRDEGLTVVFVYAGGFGHHYADYVYRGDGDFERVLKRADMHIQRRINKNWCAVSG
jgi:hypothetical protein